MKKEDILKPTTGDHIHAVLKAGVAGVPFVGGPTAEIFGYVITPPLERRRDQFIIDISNDLERLQEKVDGFDIRKLSEDEIFITTVTHAATIAIRNHQKDKLNALRNIIMNSALGNRPEEDLQMMFLHFIDTFTPLHLRLLHFFNEPKTEEWKTDLLKNIPAGSSLDGRFLDLVVTLEFVFPDLKGKKTIIDFVVKDLETNNLIDNIENSVINDRGTIFKINRDGTTSPNLSNIGKKFLAFIKEPGD